MSERDTLLERLDELIFWTRLSAMPSIRKAVVDNLRTDIDKLVYQLSDGNRSSREIANTIRRGGRSVTHVTVTNMWRKWAILNLVMPAQRRGRYMRVASLESLGIEIPQLEVPSENE